MTFFNRPTWDEFNAYLAHKHTFESSHGYLTVGPIHNAATLIRCRCGEARWFFSSMSL